MERKYLTKLGMAIALIGSAVAYTGCSDSDPATPVQDGDCFAEPVVSIMVPQSKTQDSENSNELIIPDLKEWTVAQFAERYTELEPDDLVFIKEVSDNNLQQIGDVLGVLQKSDVAYSLFLVLESNDEALTTIPEGVFTNCGALSQITLAFSTSRIEKGAFAGCDNLIKVNIPCPYAQAEEGAFPDNQGFEAYYSNADYNKFDYNASVTIHANGGVFADGSTELVWKYPEAMYPHFYTLIRNDDGRYGFAMQGRTCLPLDFLAYPEREGYQLAGVKDDDTGEIMSLDYAYPAFRSYSFTLIWNEL